MMKKISSILLAVALVVMMSVTAFAAGFTPSVEYKEAPEVVTQTNAAGETVAAIIRDANGKEIGSIKVEDLVVTASSATDKADPATKAQMDSAKEQIQSAENLSELSKDLEKVVKEVSPDTKTEDLVVRDLFDVSLKGAAADLLSQPGSSITIRFKLSGDVNSLAAILHNIGGTTWETISNNRITRNADGTVSVVFYSLSPVAFLFDAGELAVEPGAPASPQTGEPVSYTVLWVAAGVAAAYVIMKRRSSHKA